MAPVDSCVAVRPGEHACCRFAQAADRDRMAAAFVSEGLTRGDKVVYLADRDPEELVADLVGGDARVEAAIDRGQLDVRSARSVYAPLGRFDIEPMLRTAREERDRATADGYPALSMIAEMSWAGPSIPGSELVPEYERRLDALLNRADIAALCVYDTGGHLGPATLSDVAGAHEVDLSPELAGLSRTGSLWAARTDDGRALRLAGDLDFDCADALAAVLAAHFPGPLRLDLTHLAFVDVTGMRALRGRTG